MSSTADVPSVASAESAAVVSGRLHRIATARRGVEMALIVNLVAPVIGLAAHAAWLPWLLAALLAVRAVIALHASLGDDTGRRMASVLAMVVPLVNLVVMALLCARATRRIRGDAHRLPPFDPLRR